MARRGTSRSGSISSPAKDRRGHNPHPKSPLWLPFLPTILPHAPPPNSATFPSKSSHISCQERDLLQPVWWRPQPQTGWYFYHFCLAPASCLLAGGGEMCWYLVLSFLTQTRLPRCTRTETTTSKQRLPATRAAAPGPLIFAPSPPAAPLRVTARHPCSACSEAETTEAGWAERKHSISTARNGKIHRLGSEEEQVAGFAEFLEPTVLSRAQPGGTREVAGDRAQTWEAFAGNVFSPGTEASFAGAPNNR